MSPRSAEFMAAARERLATARDDLAQDHLAGAVSAAYYPMLYAARAALSERDLHAKSHSGTWGLFGKELVTGGDFDPGLARQARKAQTIRELGDYEAKPPSREDAEELVGTADRFVEAVATMLDA